MEFRAPNCESNSSSTHNIAFILSFGNYTSCSGEVQETQMIKVNLTDVLTHNWSSNICGMNGYILSRGLTVLSGLIMNDCGPLEAEDLSPKRIKDLPYRNRNLIHIPGLSIKMIIRSSSLTG